jgi:hypothetical protein
LREGKTNNEGRYEYAWILRNPDVHMCGIAGLGLFYLYRFDIAGERLQLNDPTGRLGGAYLLYSMTEGPKVGLEPEAYYKRSN